MASIADASSRVYARFYDDEGTISARDSFPRDARRYGLPLALDAGNHTPYQSPVEPTVDEHLAGVELVSPFGQALRELGVELIEAHPPQAKGRVERRFQTFQDQLIKELRLAGIATVEDANRFVEHDRPVCNPRFAVASAQPANLHRPTPPARELDGSLCLKTTRCLRKDFTIAHEGRLYQIHDTVRATHVQVEEHLECTLRLTDQGRVLGFHAIAVRPVSVAAAKPRPRSHRPVMPKSTHPGRKRWRQERGPHRQQPEQKPDISTLGRRKGHF